MTRFRIVFGWLIVGCLAASCSQRSAPTDRPAPVAAALAYPDTARVEQVDNYHGTAVADPYRWLEDLDSPETRAWIEGQNKVTFGYLEQIPGRQKLKDRLTAIWNYERFGVPQKEGGQYFFSRNDGLQNQSVIYVTDSLARDARTLIDPNKLSDDGTISLGGYAVSDDGRYMAYGLSDGGSDWRTYHVRDIQTGKDLSDEVDWVKFSGAAWTQDAGGFFYSRYDAPVEGEMLQQANYFQKLYFHALGTPQSEDQLVYHRPDQKEWGFGGSVTDDGRYLVISVWKGTERKNRLFYKDLSAPGSSVVELLNDFDAQYDFIDNDGPVFWFRTDLDAPRYRVIAIDTRNPSRSQWRELIPQSDDTLEGVNMLDDRFVAQYLVDARSEVKIFDIDGKFVRDVELPGIGSVGGFDGERTDDETFYAFTSFTTPTTIYRYDMDSGTSSVFREPEVDFDSQRFETKQVFYQSKDGTRIPMFITHRKGIDLDGNNPTLLYGYGGFNVSITPSFDVSRAVWLEMGGVLAVANLRGGGEYGKEWHDGGRLAHKQNVFDDFIASAEWLIDNDYTQSDRMAILGGSNGGLLVGACMTQRPDLFAAAIPVVGVLDMLRFHKFTIGWAWTSDYGSADDPEQFKTLYAYSPLHNLKAGTAYPATMLMTADHDDRVVPSHSFKFASALQAAHGGDAPVMIRIETRAGHGAGKPTTKQIEEKADMLAFLVRELGMDESQIR